MSASDAKSGDPDRRTAHSRLWGPPTLKRWNRRTITLTVAAVVSLWLLNEIYAQVHLQIALAHAADGDYAKALETVQGVQRNVFRRGRLRRIAELKGRGIPAASPSAAHSPQDGGTLQR